MILKYIKLANYRQHKDIEVKFDGNLIAITGKNGIGKSNFLGAIQFALTGEQPGFKKEDLLTWGETSGWVELGFSHNNFDCVIQRRIEKPAVTLKVDSDTYNGTKKVSEALEQILKIDKDVFKQSVFVRQTEIESILFTDPRERELSFQKLIGLGDAAKHNKFLTDFLNALDQPKEMDDEIERQKELISAKKQDIKRLEDVAAEISAKFAEANEEHLIDLEKKLPERQKIVKDALNSFLNFESAKNRLNKFKEENKSCLENKSVSTEGWQARLKELYQFEEKNKYAATRNATRARLQHETDNLKKQLECLPKDIDERIKTISALVDKDNFLTRDIERIKKLINGSSNSNVCPMCGSVVDHDIKQELEKELHEKECEIKEIREKTSELPKLRAAEADRDRIANKISVNDKTLESLGEFEEEQDIAKIKEEISYLNNCIKEENDKNSKFLSATAELKVLSDILQREDASLKNALSLLPKNGLVYDYDILNKALVNIENQITKVKEYRRQIDGLKLEKARLEGGIEQAKESLKEASETLAILREKNEQNKLKISKINVVKDVKDWFSYRNGPRVMTNAIMTLLTEETNKFLSQFGSAFTVIPIEEGMGFRVVFNDGRAMSNPPPEATMLSGGQKIALAVAFRFAVYSMFAGKLGLLSLDEPTAYLDDETITRFAEMLTKIKELARNMDLQVIISTHESQLSYVFDQTIKLGE